MCLTIDELPMQLYMAPVPGPRHVASIAAQDEQCQRLWCCQLQITHSTAHPVTHPNSATGTACIPLAGRQRQPRQCGKLLAVLRHLDLTSSSAASDSRVLTPVSA